MRYVHFLFAILFAIILFPSQAQQILIRNAATGNPVSDVFVYSENQKYGTYSDKKGKANLTEFPNGEIHLQHPSFHEKTILFAGENLSVEMREKIISYNEVIVSANKWEQEEDAISRQIHSVDKKTVDFQNPQTTADLLNASGQVFVQKSQLGGGSPKLRGFAANAVLLVVDGVRMNNAIFRSGNLQNVINIDPNALASSEVIFGPGSVIYGSDALGGVMDFHTVSPRWTSDNITDVTVNSLLRYSSAANERTGHVDLSVAKKRFTFFHSTSFSALDDLRAGANRSNGYEGEFERRFIARRINGADALIPNEDVNLQRDSGYNLFNTISKASFRIGQSADLTYGFYYSTTSDIPRYDNLTETTGDSDSLRHAEWYYGPQEWTMHNLRFNYYRANPLFDQARVTVAYQDFEESRNDRRFGSNQLRTRTEQVDMYSISMDFDKEINQSNICYGIDFYHNEVASDASRRNIVSGEISSAESRYPDGGSSYTSFAAYGSLIHPFSSKLTFNAGIRLNAINLEGNTSDERALANNSDRIDLKNTAINGGWGLVYMINEKNKLSYNLSTGFRAPNVDDVGKVFEVGNRLTVPNPDLKPEYTLSQELSYQRKAGLFYFQVTGFYSRLFDAILEGPFSLNGSQQIVLAGETLSVSARVNTGRAVIYGGSALLTAEFSDYWAISNSISYTGGEDVTNNEPLRHTTPVFGRTGITFRKKKVRSELYVEYNTKRDREDIPASEIVDKPFLYTANGTPGWYTINLKTSYAFTQNMQINLGIENILDSHYRPYTSGISAPGRNVIVAFRLSI